MHHACLLVAAGALVLAGCSSQGNPGAAIGSAATATSEAPAPALSGASAPAAIARPSAPATAQVDAGTASAPPGPYQYDAAAGKKLYFVTYSVCHQVTGTGMAGVFPPLKGNPVVTDPDPTKQITTVLHGVSGPITVNGAKYDGTMPAFGSKLSDADIANIINYERSSWGNHARHATADEVAAVRNSGRQNP
ncbi:MAG TPA: c-type cytochrome [Rhodanobacteraceae bacterium]